MPQVIVEYTENIVGLPVHEVLRALNRRLIESGEFQAHDVKSRVVCVREFLVGDGADAHAFVHVTLSILGGRPEATKAAISKSLMDTLHSMVPRAAGATLQLSVEVRDMDRAAYSKASV